MIHAAPRTPRASLCARLFVGAALPLVVACGLRYPTSAVPLSDELRRARAFDREGVVAFEARRYHDAIAYFEAALSNGGPPSERWNTAKCHLRLDEPEQAEADLRSYLTLSGLTAEDRREADALLDTILRRPSELTVTSVPLGLPVALDGRSLGTTPVSAWVAAGEHLVLTERGASRDERRVAAHHGHAILVELKP